MKTLKWALLYSVSVLVSPVFAGGETGTAAVTDQAAADSTEGTGQTIELKHALTNKPLALTLRPEQVLTPAVNEFHQTGVNVYSGDPERIKAGLKVYKKLCQACHLKDGTGRIGPNLTDDTWTRKRTDTEIGRFEIVYGGGAGAMQAFGLRIDQDAILEVLAFIETLRE